MKTYTRCIVRIAESADTKYAGIIANAINESAARRNKSLSVRTAEYITEKINSGLAVIAVDAMTSAWAGFCCIEAWQHQRYIANSGLIVSPSYRGNGLSGQIKTKLFDLGRKKFPAARIFSLTTCPVVIQINRQLGYKELAFEDILRDPDFLSGNTTCVDYESLMRDGGGTSNYIAMVYEPVAVFHLPSYVRLKALVSQRIRTRRRVGQLAIGH